MDALPEELLAQIVLHVEQQQVLASLCRTNLRLNRIATPILYAHFKTSYRSTPGHFLKTIIRRTDLASSVKSLQWDYSVSATNGFTAADLGVFQTTLRMFEYPLSTFAARCAESIETPRMNGELTDALFTTTLLHTPNLEEIEVVDKWYGDDVRSTRRWLDPIRMRSPHVFHHLKSASVTMTCMQFDDVMILMCLPSLQHLELCNLVEPEVRAIGLGIPNQSFSNVESLSFRSCRLDWDTVAWIMASCKTLRRFSYVSFNLALLRLSSPNNLQDLKKLLDRHSSDLEYLDIEVDVLVSNGEEHASFGSFANYPQLKHQRVWLNPFKLYRELGLLTP